MFDNENNVLLFDEEEEPVIAEEIQISELIDAEINTISSELESQIEPEIIPESVPRCIPNPTRKTLAERFPDTRPFAMSAGASLIFMAVVFLWASFVSGDIIAVFRLSPVILFFMGAEILLHIFIKKTSFTVKPSDILLSVVLITLTFLLSLASVSLNESGGSRTLAQTRFENQLKANISKDLSNFSNLKDVEINVLLLEENANTYRNLKDIKPSDNITVCFYFNSIQQSLYVFASDCRNILDTLIRYNLPFEKIEFYSVDTYNRLEFTVNLRFAADITVREIAEATNYFIGDEDFDLVLFD
ncbi:MAG: hypothetical protein FWG44_06195 [Oscillospiraceae bacterium]|nr:hypothetical protein [Oscillospiraceae bacterium]